MSHADTNFESNPCVTPPIYIYNGQYEPTDDPVYYLLFLFFTVPGVSVFAAEKMVNKT